MREYGCRILLQHDQAQRFFEEAMNPVMEGLQRRDAFLATLNAECPIRMEGSEIVMEIPDVDITALMDDESTEDLTSEHCAQTEQEKFVLEIPDAAAMVDSEYRYTAIVDAIYAECCKNVPLTSIGEKNAYKLKADLNIAA